MTERDLIRLAQAGDTDAENRLVRMHYRRATGVASEFFFPGADRDDVTQEALAGLLSGIRTYDLTSAVSFSQFAKFCMRRMCMTGVNAHGRQKHQYLNESVRVARKPSGETIEAVELLTDTLGRDPLLVVMEREELRVVVKAFGGLSKLERRALVGVLNGRTYCEIEGVPEGSKPKSIDNAVQRARLKLTHALREAA